MIADGKRIGEIRDYIEAGREQYGMQTFDQHLADLVRSKEVMFETAMAASTNPSDFELKLRMFGRLSQSVQAADIPAEEPRAELHEGPTLEGIQPGGLDFLGQ
jgi:twitching motility protein PilT